MLQDYDFTLAVGEAREVSAPGDYLYYYAGSAGGADATLRVRGRSSGLSLRLEPGQSFRLPAGQKEAAWIITPNDKAQAIPIVGVLAIGAGELGNNRITGSVEVVDGGKARTLAGAVFGWRMAVSASAVAGEKSCAQLWNPPASGKRLIVGTCYANTTGASGNVLVGWQTVQLSTAAPTQDPKSKLSGGGASVGAAYFERTAAFNASLVGNAFNGFPLQEREPVIIKPGYGLTFVAADAMAQITVTAHFIEESL